MEDDIEPRSRFKVDVVDQEPSSDRVLESYLGRCAVF